jgi:hypothetical protein
MVGGSAVSIGTPWLQESGQLKRAPERHHSHAATHAQEFQARWPACVDLSQAFAARSPWPDGVPGVRQTKPRAGFGAWQISRASNQGKQHA